VAPKRGDEEERPKLFRQSDLLFLKKSICGNSQAVIVSLNIDFKTFGAIQNPKNQ
jgi:hypothetical protein